MPSISESGACEACGQPFTSTRMAYVVRMRCVASKRFCSEACRKREEARRYRARNAASNA